MFKRRWPLLLIVLSSAGCDFELPRYQFCIDLSKRSPIPVEPEVDKILTEWQKRRAKVKSVYATFDLTIDDKSLKASRTRPGSLRYQHPEMGRIDIKAAQDGKGREIYLWTKVNVVWHVIADEKQAESFDLSKSVDKKDYNLFGLMRASQFVWLVPTDKATLQKHGAIRKLKEDSSTMTLRIENAKRPIREENGYDWMEVHLRKPELTATRLVIKEDQLTTVTYDFRSVHENVEFSESDFIPPKLDSKQWKINRMAPVKSTANATTPTKAEDDAAKQ